MRLTKRFRCITRGLLIEKGTVGEKIRGQESRRPSLSVCAWLIRFFRAMSRIVRRKNTYLLVYTVPYLSFVMVPYVIDDNPTCVEYRTSSSTITYEPLLWLANGNCTHLHVTSEIQIENTTAAVIIFNTNCFVKTHIYLWMTYVYMCMKNWKTFCETPVLLYRGILYRRNLPHTGT